MAITPTYQTYFNRRCLKWKTAILWLVYLSYILILTIKPFQFSRAHFFEFLQWRRGWWAILFTGFNPLDWILNVLLFIPYGLLTAQCGRNRDWPFKKIIWCTFTISLLTSLVAEISQLYLIRTTSLSDVLFNSLGGILGAYLNQHWNENHSLFKAFLINRGGSVVRRAARVYWAALVMVFSLPFWLNNFSNWNENYRLVIGNEATDDRPWTGILYELAIYDRTLTAEEVLQCAYQHRPESLEKNLLVRYIFKPQTGAKIPDCSGAKPGVRLQIVDSTRVVSELTPPGLRLLPGAKIWSISPMAPLVRRAQAKAQLAIEIRFQPGNLTQTGPARLVSLSANTNQRNFMLGQAGASLNFRMRTPLTGDNGARVDFFSQQPVLKPQIQHVIALFNHGVEQIYVDGQLLNESVYAISNYFPFLLGFGEGKLGKMCLGFLLLFPLGWLTQIVVKPNLWTILKGAGITLAPVVGTHAYFYGRYDQPWDVPMLLVTGLAVILSVILSQFPGGRNGL
ncbi:VanZ family protein [candidate division KSB1 bacterium]|nr:VanZ family protein [candidate division KSB1 bacterium]